MRRINLRRLITFVVSVYFLSHAIETIKPDYEINTNTTAGEEVSCGFEHEGWNNDGVLTRIDVLSGEEDKTFLKYIVDKEGVEDGWKERYSACMQAYEDRKE